MWDFMAPAERRVAVVTGATQGLGLALVQGLSERMSPDDTVYLTGRNAARVAEAMSGLRRGSAAVCGEVFDVADPESAERFAATLEDRHGGIDVVFSNAVMRITPEDDRKAIIGSYVEVNNLGTTRLMRAFAPCLRDGGRLLIVASTLGTLHYLAPILHAKFADLATLDEVDEAVRQWRDAVQKGSDIGSAWPAFINIPSKIALVAAVRALARARRPDDLARGVLIAATCPGMIDTATSRPWFDMSRAQSPAQAAVALLDLALSSVKPEHYGELVRFGRTLPWAS
jgi:NAD(P)-dependent dehydrogenase (short-subunit alcohol dehydrogenase family)